MPDCPSRGVQPRDEWGVRVQGGRGRMSDPYLPIRSSSRREAPGPPPHLPVRPRGYLLACPPESFCPSSMHGISPSGTPAVSPTHPTPVHSGAVIRRTRMTWDLGSCGPPSRKPPWLPATMADVLHLGPGGEGTALQPADQASLQLRLTLRLCSCPPHCRKTGGLQAECGRGDTVRNRAEAEAADGAGNGAGAAEAPRLGAAVGGGR